MTLLAFGDRVQEWAQNIGTTPIVLQGASAATVRTFAAAGLDGKSVPYVILHRVSGQWEVGTGVYTAGTKTLTRVTVWSSSLGTPALVAFQAGVVDVWVDLPSAKIVAQDADSSQITAPGPVAATAFALPTGTRQPSPGGFVGLADNVTPVTIAALGTVALGDAGTFAVASILMSDGKFCQALLLGAQHAVNLVTEVNLADWGTSAGQRTYNVYWDGPSARYVVQNDGSGPIQCYIYKVGLIT